MEKQPEYEFVKASLEEVLRVVINHELGDYYFVAPEKKEYRCETLSLEQLKLHRNQLYRRVEITPEVKREREVEELAREIWNANPISIAENFESDIVPEWKSAYRQMAKAAIEWMESKK